MIKKILPLFLLLTACGGTDQEKTHSEKPKDMVLMGEKVQGDFNGDGEIESVEVIMTKEGKGSPQTDSDYEPYEYEIKISDQSISTKGISYGSFPKMINEGDLNGDGKDELSVVSYSPNGTQVELTVMNYDGKSWKELLKPQVEPGMGTDLTLEDLQKRVYVKNGKIHYLNSDIAGVLTEKQL